MSKLKYPFALQECSSLNGAQQQYENRNTSKKELKLANTFSIPSFEKVKIKLSNIQIHMSRICQLSSGQLVFGEPKWH